MDLQRKTARMRQWIELGVREKLTNVELAQRAGIHPRTLRRWSEKFREGDEARQAAGLESVVVERRQGEEDPVALPEPFIKSVGSKLGSASRIEIRLPDDRQITFEGAVNVELIASVIRVVAQC